MSVAVDKQTGEIVEAEMLWQIEADGGVDKDRYRCIGCDVKMWPASYGLTNVNRPYFQLRPPPGHAEDCDVERFEQKGKTGKKERLTPRGGEFPLPYPARLVLRDPREVNEPDDNGDNNLDGEEVRNRRREPRDPDAPRIQRPTNAGTIRPICRSFIDFPFDRDRPLTIDGIEGNDYRSIFKKLKFNLPPNPDTLRQMDVPKLFYAELSWKAATKTDDFLEITLSAGEWGEDKKKPPRSPFRVRIDWRQWSAGRRTAVANEIDVTRKEGPKESSKKGYLFFIGTQDAEDLTLIHVSDSRLICSLAADIQYPSYR